MPKSAKYDMTSPESLLYTSLCDVRAAWVQLEDDDSGKIIRSEIQQRRPFRAARLVDDSKRFLFLNFSRRSHSTALYNYLIRASINGVCLDNIEFVLETRTRSFVAGLTFSYRFSFLGITESGIKEAQVIFFQEDRKYSVCKLLEECGDLMDVFINSGPGKYAARLGLSFSSTIATYKVGTSSFLYFHCIYSPQPWLNVIQ